MIKDNTDCPYCHDIFDQYCNLFKEYRNCDKVDCEVLKMLKENEKLKQQVEKFIEGKQYETCPYRSTDMGCDYCDYRDKDLKNEIIN